MTAATPPGPGDWRPPLSPVSQPGSEGWTVDNLDAPTGRSPGVLCAVCWRDRAECQADRQSLHDFYPAPDADPVALLDRLAELREAATPGPWSWSGKDDGNGGPYLDGPDDAPVLSGWGHDWWGVNVSDEDKALIVAAVNALPALVGALRAVLDLADRWESQIDDGTNPWDRVTIRSHSDHLRRALAAALLPREATGPGEEER